MADPTQLDRIEAAQADLAADMAAVRSLLQTIVTKEIQIMSNQDAMKAALDAVNTATSQEAALLLTLNPKLDAVQALITNLVNTAGVPQSLIDEANAILPGLQGISATTTAQAARLDAMGVDPRNPVPVAPPTA